ncbi:MAG: DNA repair helicase XPB [Chloroflexia bacterium]
MSYVPQNPLIVQSDRSLLLEVDNSLYEAARDELARFAELEKSPEHIHTYRVTPLSLWNAASAGITATDILGSLERYSKFDLPRNVLADIEDYISRFGRVKLLKSEASDLILRSDDPMLIAEIARNKRVQPYVLAQPDRNTLTIDPKMRGHVKQALVLFGYPAEDLAGYTEGAPLELVLRGESARDQGPFTLRSYQTDAVGAFWAGGTVHGGSGVVVLPCGAGKTVVGMGAMANARTSTLILTPSTIAVRQWIAEILDKTTLTEEEVGEYTGDKKVVRPVTVTTYQMLTYRPSVSAVDEETGEVGEFPHFDIFTAQDWGLIIYDEVHLLPAPVFRITAEIQARRRLGLTATLVREDGRETDVFSLIGPKKYDVPWKDLEKQGWIATAECTEVRVPLTPEERMEYMLVDDSRIKYRIAAENPLKMDLLQELLQRHRSDAVLVIGQYIEQLKAIAKQFDAPLVTGKTPNNERDRLYGDFREGKLKLLVVSKVANFAIDLPDANVAIQVSGTFGSRQEEAQRLGRILRPKKDGSIANFYSLVTHDTKDQDFSTNRQLFLTEQGYRYNIVDASAILPDLPERLAQMQAEFEQRRANGEFDLNALQEKANKRGKGSADDEVDAEAKPRKRGRKKAVESPAEPMAEGVITDVAAGAEDQHPTERRKGRPPKESPARDHLRLVK